MGKIAALDVGDKTIGVAFSDDERRMALPGVTLRRSRDIKADFAALRTLFAEHRPDEIVIGLPLMMSGERGIQVEKVEAFAAALRGSVRVPIHFQDERLSTLEAGRGMLSAGRRGRDLKQTIDSVAASLILQSYMDRLRAAEAGADTEPGD